MSAPEREHTFASTSVKRCACPGCRTITSQSCCDRHRLALFEPLAREIIDGLLTTTAAMTATTTEERTA